MCLAIPSKVVEINKDGTAVVDTMGVKRKVSLELMQEDLKEGDYVLIHVGFVIQKLDEEEALRSLELFEEILEDMQEVDSYGDYHRSYEPQEGVQELRQD